MDRNDVLLPQTEAELDEFVKGIIQQFEIPDEPYTYEAIATAIMHLPPTQAFAQPRYFADCIRKSLANRAAYVRLETFKEQRAARAKEIKDAQDKADAEAKTAAELATAS